MARHFFNTADLTLDRVSYLFAGEPGAGKTKMLGEVLAEYGKAGYVIDFPKEKGLLTIKHLGIDGETLDTYEDWKGFLNDVASGKLKDKKALGIDGLPRFYRDIVIPSLFPHKTPEATDFTSIHKRFEDEVTLVKRHVPVIVATALVDRSMDQVRQELYITPDLPGKMAVGVAALFDYVLYLESEAIGTTVHYRCLTAPRGKMVVKVRGQRAPIPVISLPVDKPAWPVVKSELQAALEGKPSPSLAAVKQTAQGGK